MSHLHDTVLESLRGGLIVSCQALEDEPLHGPEFMAAMARAAEQGGAVGIRANTPVDIRAIKAACSLPVIGLYKRNYPNSDIYITPTMAEVRDVIAAGAQVVAIDATARPRPDGLDLPALFARIKREWEILILADISTYEEGVAAVAAGADLVSTTMSGYTPYSPQQTGPDLELVQRLARDLPVPVVGEGRIWSLAEAKQALAAGAHAVVVGTAITRPHEITKRFVTALQGDGGEPRG